MTKNGLVDSKQALELLGLYDPDKKQKPNHRYIGWLVKRELLPRHAVGPRSFRYHVDDLKSLLEDVNMKGLSLTTKP